MFLRPLHLLQFAAVFGLFAIGLTPARARIGETMEECVERYGPSYGSLPSICGRSGELCHLFKRNIDTEGKIKTILMKIEFIEGKAAYLRISSAAISDEDARDLVDKNSGESTWMPPQSINERSYYLTDDKKRQACVFRLGEVRVVEVFSSGMTDLLNAYRLAMLENPSVKQPSRNPTGGLDDPPRGDKNGKATPNSGATKGF